MQMPAAARLPVQSPKPGSGWQSVTYLHPVHGEKSVRSRQATPMPKLAGLREAATSQSESEVSAGDAPEVNQQGPALQSSSLQCSEPEQVSSATGMVSMTTTSCSVMLLGGNSLSEAVEDRLGQHTNAAL